MEMLFSGFILAETFGLAYDMDFKMLMRDIHPVLLISYSPKNERRTNWGRKVTFHHLKLSVSQAEWILEAG
jgi:hypothetical protein